MDTKKAIFLRTKELDVGSVAQVERNAIADAMSSLSVLRRECKSPKGIEAETRPAVGQVAPLSALSFSALHRSEQTRNAAATTVRCYSRKDASSHVRQRGRQHCTTSCDRIRIVRTLYQIEQIWPARRPKLMYRS
jgi:hypothetical protein